MSLKEFVLIEDSIQLPMVKIKNLKKACNYEAWQNFESVKTYISKILKDRKLYNIKFQLINKSS